MPSESESTPAHPALAGSEEPPRILIVDDNAAIHKDFTKLFAWDEPDEETAEMELLLFGAALAAPAQTFRCRLDHAMQGEEAIAMVQQAVSESDPYAMVFTDVRMPPGIDGVVAAKEFLASDPFVQVVICSAYSDHSWADIAAASRGTDRLLIIKKPFEAIEVRQAALALCVKSRQARALAARVNDLEASVQARSRKLEEANTSLRTQIPERERVGSELRLAQRLEAVGQLATGTAHEMSTAIQSIDDHASFLAKAFTNLAVAAEIATQILEQVEAGVMTSAAVTEARTALSRCQLEFVLERGPRAVEATREGVRTVVEIVQGMQEFSHPRGDTPLRS